jgi:hypothetical protein
VLPDTQYYTNKQSDNASNTYRKQMQWIIDHRESNNIKFVVHVGDITNNNTPSQWAVADHAHDMLDAVDMPYSVLPGNHDYLTSNGWARGSTLLDDYFGPDRFAGKSWYGGHYGNSNANNYTYFQVGLMKFLVLSLEYSPRKDVFCWADDVIATHPDHRVIIATHCYQTHGGGYSGGCPNPDYTAIGSNGSGIWSELASRHSNVFLVLSGHVGDSEYRTKEGNAGNTVHEMLVDYQFEAACTASSASACNNHCSEGVYTGNGWMRQLTFDPMANHVHAETFTVEDGNTSMFPGGVPVLFCSPYFTSTDPDTNGDNWYSSDPTDPEHRFDFSYDMSSPVQYTWEDLDKQGFLDRTVNTVSSGDQLRPKVAIAPSGAFVVAYEDDSSDADGAGNFDIKVRGFDPGGCAGFSDRVVNTVTSGHQAQPSVAMDQSGNFVVVWADDNDDNGVYQIRGRGFGADGSERIPEFTVNTTGTGQQVRPVVAMAPDGRFVVAWEDDQDKDGNEQIWVRGFAADGTEAFGDRSVHTDNAGVRIAPSVAMDSEGNFVVAWQDDSDGNGVYQIHARGFLASGNERFARRTVNSIDDGQQRNPAIGMDAAGSFVVAWEDDQDGNGVYDVLARGFGSTGEQRIADFRVHTAAAGQQFAPSLAVEPGGGFVATWEDDADSDGGYRVRGRSFHADGTEWKAEWMVNRVDAGQATAPHASMNAAGTIVVVWEDDRDGNGAYQIIARGVDSP